MGTLVDAKNIRGVYYTGAKDVVAVNDVSVKIEEGEVLGLAGESGSGKTTLGSIIAGAGRRGQDPPYLAGRRGLHAAAGCDELRQSDQAHSAPRL
jgi:ABC-type dipeptide/oligopeptide/nickel transport system ATPase subunit